MSRKARAIGFYLLGVLLGGVCWLLVVRSDADRICHRRLRITPARLLGVYLVQSQVLRVVVPRRTVPGPIGDLGSDPGVDGDPGHPTRARRSGLLLTVVATFVPFYVFVFVNPHGLYLAYLFPFLYLALSACIDDLMQRGYMEAGRQSVWRTPAIAGVAILAVVLGLAMARGIVEVHRGWQQRRAGGYAGYIAELKAYIPANAVVMGQPRWFSNLASPTNPTTQTDILRGSRTRLTRKSGICWDGASRRRWLRRGFSI